ncbi:DUF5655 domain-containing protein [Streptomyces sp. CA-181903]|uniref:DUF5655 domain-containing protein n=1 Tax=Streptomyces sp. CA-181903 TaxID=3240055 RepID=UPI003D90AF01
MRMFHTQGDVVEVVSRLAEVEAEVQDLVEANLEAMLGVRFLESEYSTGPVHGGRIDTLGVDENGAPVVIEFKRATDAGVINQGLFYLSWLMDHKAEFGHLVRDRLGAAVAAQVLWSAPRLICVAGDFTRYDVHALREHRRSIDLVRYRFFGDDHFGLETVASVAAPSALPRARRTSGSAEPGVRAAEGVMEELYAEVDQVLLGLGDDITKVQRKTYRAYQRLRNFACLCPPQKNKLLVYLKINPMEVDLVPGFTRNVTGLGHHGTGDLEVRLLISRDLERAQDLFRLSYTAA